MIEQERQIPQPIMPSLLRTDTGKVTIPQDKKGEFWQIRNPGRGVKTSAGPLFGEADFGRDTIEFSRHVLSLIPSGEHTQRPRHQEYAAIAHEIILLHASLMGVKDNSKNDEEPGKSFHEFRMLERDGKPVSEAGKNNFHRLAGRWGTEQVEQGGKSVEAMIYYGSIDATPGDLLLIAEYAKKVDPKILDEKVQLKDGRAITIRERLLMGSDWLQKQIESSPLHLLEFQTQNPKFGHRIQVWQDSRSSMLHADGSLPNHHAPLAATNVQGLAYDALVGVSELLETDTPEKAKSLQDTARQLQKSVLTHLWDDDLQYFAVGMDRDNNGSPRRINTLTSGPAELLQTRIFDTLSPSEKEKYVGGIVETIYSPQFLADIGIRCRSTTHTQLVPFSDYHGTSAVWFKETFAVLNGFRKQGFVELTEQVENRFLNGVNIAGTREFLYVTPDGRVMYDPHSDYKVEANHQEIAGTNIPELKQAWTISTALHIKEERGRRDRNRPEMKEEGAFISWKYNLETAALVNNPIVNVLKTRSALRAAYPTTYSLSINTDEGRERNRVNFYPEYASSK